MLKRLRCRPSSQVEGPTLTVTAGADTAPSLRPPEEEVAASSATSQGNSFSNPDGEREQSQQLFQTSSPNLSIPTVPPSPGSATGSTNNVEATMVGTSTTGAWGDRRMSSSGGGGAVGEGQVSNSTPLSPPRARELAADDAPPELDALRPTFSKTARSIPRRLPTVTLAPVGVGSDSSPLPSLFSATSSTTSDAVPANWVNSQWQPHHYHGRIPAPDLGHGHNITSGSSTSSNLPGPPRLGSSENINASTPAPPPPPPHHGSGTVAPVAGMRTRTGTDP
ncbi:unnamed protein product, partial [Sphacelaria rigidula]